MVMYADLLISIVGPLYSFAKHCSSSEKRSCNRFPLLDLNFAFDPWETTNPCVKQRGPRSTTRCNVRVSLCKLSVPSNNVLSPLYDRIYCSTTKDIIKLVVIKQDERVPFRAYADFQESPSNFRRGNGSVRLIASLSGCDIFNVHLARSATC